jgi:hypothetical protein
LAIALSAWYTILLEQLLDIVYTSYYSFIHAFNTRHAEKWQFWGCLVKERKIEVFIWFLYNISRKDKEIKLIKYFLGLLCFSGHDPAVLIYCAEHVHGARNATMM